MSRIRYNGTLDELQSLVESFGYRGTWAESKQGIQVFKSTAGGLTLNWWPKSSKKTLLPRGVKSEAFVQRFNSHFALGVAPIEKSALVGQSVPFGNITVGDFIAKGGFGVVHKASIAGVRFPFAVKFLDPHPFNPNVESARARFFQEAETLFRLRHPNIVAIYGVGTHTDGRPYILMENFEGVNLSQAKETGGVDSSAALAYVEMFAAGLCHAHSMGVVHRDITPRNLMIRTDEFGTHTARVLDFGIAAALDPEGARLTRTGGTCVGDTFSAPELIADPRQRNSSCDVYSLGACWLWLLTGHAGKGLGWSEALHHTVPPDYARVVLSCLRPLEERCSMGELLKCVRALVNGASPATSRQ